MLVAGCSRAGHARATGAAAGSRRQAGRVTAVAGRCAAHPARPARDLCPRCGRARCAADRALGDRCAVCDEAAAQGPRPALAVLARAGAVGVIGAVVGAALGQEYVGAHVFSVVFPLLVGLVMAAVAAAWAGPVWPPMRHAVAAVAATCAGLSAALDFRFTSEPFGPVGRWLPPVVAAVAAGLVGVQVLARRPVSGAAAAGRGPASTSGR